MSHGSENEEEEGNPYVQCCHLPPSDDKKVLWIQWVIYQLIDQAKAALPVVTFVFFFMLVILGQTPSDVMELSYGMLFVIVGLVFFMYVAPFLQCFCVTFCACTASSLALCPWATRSVCCCPPKCTGPSCMCSAVERFLRCICVTSLHVLNRRRHRHRCHVRRTSHWSASQCARINKSSVTIPPQVLKTAASLVQEGNAPYLFDLLVKRQNTLIFSVALGVGLSTWLGTIPLRTEKALCIRLPLPGMLRIVKKWSIKPLIYVCFAIALGLTVVVEAQVMRALQQLPPSIHILIFRPLGIATTTAAHCPQGTRKDILGLAWDMGAVTTGPVTVPLVISLGNGIAASVIPRPPLLPSSHRLFVCVDGHNALLKPLFYTPWREI